jgi:hypothetical protein
LVKQGIQIQKSLARVNYTNNNFNLRRWCVLTEENLCTFEKERVYLNPTEIISVARIKTIKSDDKTSSNIIVKLILNKSINFIINRK